MGALEARALAPAPTYKRGTPDSPHYASAACSSARVITTNVQAASHEQSPLVAMNIDNPNTPCTRARRVTARGATPTDSAML